MRLRNVDPLTQLPLFPNDVFANDAVDAALRHLLEDIKNDAAREASGALDNAGVLAEVCAAH